MIPNCEGCEEEYREGLRMLKKGYDVCWEGLGEQGKHLFITVFDKGELVLG